MLRQINRSRDVFAIVSTVRMAIVLNGLKLKPTRENILELAIALAPETPVEIDEPSQADWRLYELDPSNPCPIHCLMMPRWLVVGTCAASGNDAYPFAELDPTVWLDGIEETLKAMPPLLITDGVKLMVSNLLEAAKKGQDNLPDIRAALKRKGEAIKNNEPCPDYDEDEDTTHVVVISL